jgi:pSer/pThr/pTyr-binding forkhead associated (FHA) protein
MQIKIECQGEEQIFSLVSNKPTSIGRSQESDIQLSYDGISRNHVVIEEESGSFYVTDVGSTNGTFINDERLELNAKTPFNSFFPIKLGFNVFISLIDEVESKGINLAPPIKESTNSQIQIKAEEPAQKTSTNLKIKSDKTSSTQSRKNLNPKATKKIKENDPSPILFVLKYVIFGAIAVAVFSYNKWSHLLEEKVPASESATTTPAQEVKSAEITPAEPPLKLTKEEYQKALLEPRCTSAKEMEFCERMKVLYERKPHEGVYIFANIIYIFYDLFNDYEIFPQKFPYTDAEKEQFKIDANKKYGRKTKTKAFEETLKVASVKMEQAHIVFGLNEIFFNDYSDLFKKYEEIQFIVITPLVEQRGKLENGNPFILRVSNIAKAPEDIKYLIKNAALSGDITGIDAFLKTLK